MSNTSPRRNCSISSEVGHQHHKHVQGQSRRRVSTGSVRRKSASNHGRCRSSVATTVPSSVYKEQQQQHRKNKQLRHQIKSDPLLRCCFPFLSFLCKQTCYVLRHFRFLTNSSEEKGYLRIKASFHANSVLHLKLGL